VSNDILSLRRQCRKFLSSSSIRARLTILQFRAGVIQVYNTLYL